MGLNWQNMVAVSGLLLFLTACASPPTSEIRKSFTLPVLTMAELHQLVDETIEAQGDESAQPLAIARVLRGVKGYHPDDAKFANCRARLVNAVIAKPEVLAQARALARIAKSYAAVRVTKKPNTDGMVTKSGRPPPCYDLSSAKLIVCEDI